MSTLFIYEVHCKYFSVQGVYTTSTPKQIHRISFFSSHEVHMPNFLISFLYSNEEKNRVEENTLFKNRFPAPRILAGI